MIDMLNQCDYASLVTTGLNLWWRFNVGGVDTGVANMASTPVQQEKTADGQFARGQMGDLLMPIVAPPGVPEKFRWDWDKAREQATGISSVINTAQSIVAIIQAIYGQYGALVNAARGWYTHFSEEYPRDEDHWKGVVPPTPLVQRMSPLVQYLGTNVQPDYGVRAAPDVIGSGNSAGQLTPWSVGGLSVERMMSNVRGAVREWDRAGGPVIPSDTPTKQLALRDPSTTPSPKYPQLSAPGTQLVETPGAYKVPETPSTTLAPPPPPPPPSTPANPAAKMFLASTVAAVGAFTVYRLNRRKR
jgi:hypothetical protein